MCNFRDFFFFYRSVSCVIAATVFTLCLIILFQWWQLDSQQKVIDLLEEQRIEVASQLKATQMMLDEERRHSRSPFEWEWR